MYRNPQFQNYIYRFEKDLDSWCFPFRQKLNITFIIEIYVYIFSENLGKKSTIFKHDILRPELSGGTW